MRPEPAPSHLRFLRSIGLIAALLLQAAMVPAAIAGISDPLSGPGRVELAGTTEILSQHSGVIRIRIPAPTQLDVREFLTRADGPNEHATLQGGGRFIGIAITHDPPQPFDPIVLLGRFRTYTMEGCRRGTTLNLVSPSEQEVGARWLSLERGDYRLYLVTDGAPVRVGLRLRGLRGTVTIRPTPSDGIDVETPTVGLSDTAAGLVYSASGSYTLTSEGIVVAVLWVQSERFTTVAMGDCGYRSRDPRPPQPLETGPQCAAWNSATGAGWDRIDTVSAAGQPLLVVLRIVRGNLDPDTYTEGLWYASASPVERAGSQAFGLSFG